MSLTMHLLTILKLTWPLFKTAADDAEKSEPTTDLLNIDFEYLKTLKDDSGINMDFLDDIQKHCFSRAVKSNDAILEENEMLIVQLVQKQLLRLNQSPHMTLSMADGPGDDEAQTAQKFIKNLKNLILEVTPSALLGNDIRLVESMCSTNVAEEQNESQMSETSRLLNFCEKRCSSDHHQIENISSHLLQPFNVII
ncbi:Septin-5 [Trichinella spiralis]|uniref:Septin-5 n=1 Tax=Trichinella spiralis TaxID=6334 RepID=A0ABR3K9T4_TRISP